MYVRGYVYEISHLPVIGVGGPAGFGPPWARCGGAKSSRGARAPAHGLRFTCARDGAGCGVLSSVCQEEFPTFPEGSQGFRSEIELETADRTAARIRLL